MSTREGATEDGLAKMMVGREVLLRVDKQPADVVHVQVSEHHVGHVLDAEHAFDGGVGLQGGLRRAGGHRLDAARPRDAEGVGRAGPEHRLHGDPTRHRDAFASRCATRDRERQVGTAYGFGLFVDNAFAGEININNVVRGAFQCGVVGYWIDERQAGNRYVAEGLAVLCRFAFDELHLHRLEICIVPRNTNSRRVMEVLRIRDEGVAILGESGSGKSVALHMLEDFGFYCIDNIPAALLKPFVSYTVRSPEPRYERGYGAMFSAHIGQADEGCDFDYLETSYGAPVEEPVIY